MDAILDDRLETVDPWQRTLCLIADEMAQQAKVTPESLQTLVSHYGSDNDACRALFVMAWFNMLTRYVDSTGVPIETGPNRSAAHGSAGPTDFR